MHPGLVLLLLTPLALAGVALAVIRVVPAGHAGVVLRAGRVVRSTSPGLVLVVPVIDRVRAAPLRPETLDPLGVSATTSDGAQVRFAVSVLWRVVDPEPAVLAEPDPRTVTARAVERTLVHVVGSHLLGDLVIHRRELVEALPERANQLLDGAGTVVEDVALLDADVRVGPALLRLLA